MLLFNIAIRWGCGRPAIKYGRSQVAQKIYPNRRPFTSSATASGAGQVNINLEYK